MRADARENQDRILDAAAQAFARDGADTGLKAIAKAAGVGIATPYRRFPTREELAELEPEQALREWMERFVAYIMRKKGMADALPTIVAAREGLRAHSRGLLRGAIDRMLEASGLREDIPADDMMMAIGGVTLSTAHEDQRRLASRLLDLVPAGLRRPAPLP